MANSETTTTTTVKDTTTTTTVAPETTNTTTIAAGEAALNVAEPKGEVAIDQHAEADHLQEQKASERFDDARQEALRNHDAEHAGDDNDYETEISRDKVEDKE